MQHYNLNQLFGMIFINKFKTILRFGNLALKVTRRENILCNNVRCTSRRYWWFLGSFQCYFQNSRKVKLVFGVLKAPTNEVFVVQLLSIRIHLLVLGLQDMGSSVWKILMNLNWSRIIYNLNWSKLGGWVNRSTVNKYGLL